MSLTRVRTGVVLLNRPLLIAGTALLGVAGSQVVEQITLRDCLLGIGAIGLMYVGDVGRSVDVLVGNSLPRDATRALVQSTRAHNLAASRLVLPGLALAVGCLGAVVGLSLADRGDSPPSTASAASILAPESYRVSSGPLALPLSCPKGCAVSARLVMSGKRPRAILDLPRLRGSSTIRLRVSKQGAIATGNAPTTIVIRVSSERSAPLEAVVKVVA